MVEKYPCMCAYRHMFRHYVHKHKHEHTHTHTHTHTNITSNAALWQRVFVQIVSLVDERNESTEIRNRHNVKRRYALLLKQGLEGRHELRYCSEELEDLLLQMFGLWLSIL
jgi:hypothetical protein